MKNANRNLYPWAFVISFLILIGLIAFLIFNTYQLEDKNYQIMQLQQIQNAYGAKIMKDKIFPGGDAIFESSLAPCLPIWYDKLLGKSPDAAAYGNACMTRFLDRMRENQPLNDIFEEIVRQQQLDTALVYLFHFDKLEVYDSKDNDWVSFFESTGANREGALSGTLQKVNDNNRAFQLAVSEQIPIPYRFTYSLYVDYENRTWRIIQYMAPVFLLSLACLAIIVFLSYRTYKNWINQRKLADLKTSFLNHIRHEFNTPLTTILVSAHSLIDHDKDRKDQEMLQLAQIIERQAKRLKEYFAKVMESVTLQEQKANIVAIPIDLLTQQILDELRLRYGAQIVIEYQTVGADIQLSLDEDYYFSILDNLISNAIKFNDHDHKFIRLSWGKRQDQFFLKIEDNARGITETDAKKIFTAFFRAPSSDNKPGLGLGLYYVKSCLDRMNWTIELESSPSGGTIFYIYVKDESFNDERPD